MGVGTPLAVAVNVASFPTTTVRSVGWVVIVGAEGVELTVKVAASVVAEPALLVKTAWYL